MAISAQTVWELRPTNGVDTNGGAFVAGASGSDFSQQNAKNSGASNKSTTDAAGAGSTTITSATAAFTSAIVGNIIYLQGGSGSLSAGWYQVVTFTNSTTIVVDRTVASGTGITMNIGGALASLSQLATNFVAGNAGFLKGEATFGITTGATFSATSGSLRSRLRGYTTTRGDNGKVTIQISSGSGITALTFSGTGWDVANLTVDCNSLTTSKGIAISGISCRLYNVTVKNFTVSGIAPAASGCYVTNCEVTAGTSAATAAISVSSLSLGLAIVGNWIHDNACPGISVTTNGGTTIAGNLITNNSGASSDGIVVTGSFCFAFSNTVYKAGRNGIYFNAGPFAAAFALNNLITDCGGWGLIGGASASDYASPFDDGNAYYNNTSGNREFLDDTGSTNAINGVSGLTYTNVRDVALTTGTPYNNAGSNDYTLNNLPGQGALLRGTGVPVGVLTNTGVSSPDFGAYQTGIGGLLVHPGMSGGMRG